MHNNNQNDVEPSTKATINHHRRNNNHNSNNNNADESSQQAAKVGSSTSHNMRATRVRPIDPPMREASSTSSSSRQSSDITTKACSHNMFTVCVYGLVLVCGFYVCACAHASKYITHTDSIWNIYAQRLYDAVRCVEHFGEVVSTTTSRTNERTSSACGFIIDLFTSLHTRICNARMRICICSLFFCCRERETSTERDTERHSGSSASGVDFPAAFNPSCSFCRYK